MSFIQEMEERDYDNACFFSRADRFAGFDRGDSDWEAERRAQNEQWEEEYQNDNSHPSEAWLCNWDGDHPFWYRNPKYTGPAMPHPMEYDDGSNDIPC